MGISCNEMLHFTKYNSKLSVLRSAAVHDYDCDDDCDNCDPIFSDYWIKIISKICVVKKEQSHEYAQNPGLKVKKKSKAFLLLLVFSKSFLFAHFCAMKGY